MFTSRYTRKRSWVSPAKVVLPQENIEVSLAAEKVELDAWLDLFEAAPAPVRAAFELASIRIGAMGLLASRGIPINEFNRVMGVNTTTLSEADSEFESSRL
ncbi:hypothetical protein [Pseudomonas sp. 2822-15]|uniref:hypothetical protein n=1 Tax=Pseudomonas sp. 2822-15 TaxID=1712677 RepID=UPI00117A5B70|nr:hypothetical protein [Pseudomonas sp. 2822-15]